MGKRRSQAPQAPDPVATAAAQTQQNIATANANANINRVNQVTPWGSQTYSQGPKNADGTSQWTQTTTLDPTQQSLLDSSNRVSQSMANLGESQLGNVNRQLSQPLSYGNAPAQVTGVQGGPLQNSVDMSRVPNLVGGDDLAGDLATQRDSLYNQSKAFLDPQWKQDQSDLENKLVQQGVLQNSDAWNRAVGDFSRNKEFAYNNARNSAITGGGAEQSRLFSIGLASNQNAYNQAVNNAGFANSAQQQGFAQNMANADLQNQGRATAINEANYLRNQPLNELNALRTGSQVSAPQFGGTPQSNVGGTDIAGLYNNQYQSQLAGFNAQQAQNNGITSGLFGLGASFLGSDRSIKQDISMVGVRADGLGIYSYRYKPEYRAKWGEGLHVGVMADEVEAVYPHATRQHPDGYKMVNYGVI